jgi:TonB family protein
MPGERSTGTFGDLTALRAGTETSARPPVAGTGAFASLDPAITKPLAKPTVEQSQFGTVTAMPSASAIRPKSSDSRSAALEILQKPRPVYSDEARRLQIEGEVTLEMSFPASGPARLLRVLHGLGHGLDESATKAATGIRFRPAIEYGRPVDTVATVRIEFQLAF